MFLGEFIPCFEAGATPCNWPSSGRPFDLLPFFKQDAILKESIAVARIEIWILIFKRLF
jgi:hypothetical protein